MKINIVLPKPSLSGGIKVLCKLSYFLAQKGHEVTILYEAISPFCYFERLLIALGSNRYFQSSEYDLYFIKSNPVRSIKYSNNLEKYIPDADITIASFWTTAETISKLPDSKGKKFYFVMDYGAEGQEIENILPTWSLPLNKFTISKYISELMKSSLKTDHNFTYIYPGMDDFILSPNIRKKQAKPTIGYLYRKEPSKGAKLFCDAATLLKKHNTNIDFKILGPDKPNKEIESICNYNYFFKPKEESLLNIYRSVDFWIYTSQKEGLGMPIIEAMASGTPVISTNVGDAKEFLAVGGGKLLKSFSEVELYESATEFINMNDNEWQKISKEASEITKNLTWNRTAENLINILTSY